MQTALAVKIGHFVISPLEFPSTSKTLQLMFQAVSTQISFPQQEEKILAFWKEHAIYAESLRQRAGAPSFVFYEGLPQPTAYPILVTV